MIWIRTIARDWRRAVSAVPPDRRLWAAVALLGWWLSPLTAWNDAFTNIPLSIGIAYLIAAAGLPVDPKAASVGAYIFTNVLGIVLLWIGAGKLSIRRRPAERKVRLRWFLWTGLRIAVYAVLVYATVWSIGKLLA